MATGVLVESSHPRCEALNSPESANLIIDSQSRSLSPPAAAELLLLER